MIFRKFLPLILMLACIVSLVGCERSISRIQEDSTEKASTPGTVSITIEAASDSQITFEKVSVGSDATVLDAMEKARADTKNSGKSESSEKTEDQTDLDFSFIGSGETAFLKSINGLENEGAGARNWMFKVNNTKGDRSFAAFKIKDGDKIVWQFKEFKDEKDESNQSE